jgi:hypothetical protein
MSTPKELFNGNQITSIGDSSRIASGVPGQEAADNITFANLRSNLMWGRRDIDLVAGENTILLQKTARTPFYFLLLDEKNGVSVRKVSQAFDRFVVEALEATTIDYLILDL